MDIDERMQRLQGLFEPLERGHTALIRKLESLWDSLPPMSSLLDPESSLTPRQRMMLEILRDDPITAGAWRDLQGRRYSIPATLMGKTREQGNFMAPSMVDPQRGQELPMRMSPWIQGQADMYGPGLSRPPQSPPLPLRPYPFMPQPGTGPVFRTNPQGPVRNIYG